MGEKEIISIPGICMIKGDKYSISGEYEIIRKNHGIHCKLCYIQSDERCDSCSLGDDKDELCKLRKAALNFQG